MGGHLHDAQPPHEESNRCKRTPFEQHLCADGCTHPKHSTEWPDMEDPRSQLSQIGSQMLPTQSHEQAGHEPTADGRGPRGPKDTESRKTELSEDPGVVEKCIRKIGDQYRYHDRLRAMVSLQRLAQYDESEKRPYGRQDAIHVARCERDHFLRLLRERENRGDCQEQQ